MDRAEEEWYNRGIATLSLSERGGPSQTGPTDCLHQCGNKRLCRLGVTPSISTLGSQMSEAPFCLYAACLLIEILHTGHSRLIPHQWKGCLGPVCTCTGCEWAGMPTARIAQPCSMPCP